MKRIYHITLTYLLFCLGSATVQAQGGDAKSNLALVPYPTQVVTKAGSFAIRANTGLKFNPIFKNEATYLNELIANATTVPLKYTEPTSANNLIELQLDNTKTSSKEAYSISITNNKVTLRSNNPTGMFRAVQTLRQLFPVEVEQKGINAVSLVLPALEISDNPVFDWRGLHLDVSRHFFSIDYLKKLVNVMALYKMNKLHLHLTDDQGWRIEIKKYPKLTEEGAWRRFNNQDSSCIKLSKENPDMAIDPRYIVQKNGEQRYGGFYTQQQMKEFVAYAATKHIDIIPEIDMPGHMMAAIHSYPYLSCAGGSKWGELFTTPICPCNESTYEFAENVFSEIMEIFPSEFIHLGADEVDRKSWGETPACKELMAKEGIKTLAELQSYFVLRMEKFFKSKGRKLIGWDEILEGGISPTANVMYWRAWVPDAPIHAAKNGNKVIMSPGNPLYFDYAPDAHSLENIYQFHVIPTKLTPEEGKAIVGAQANLWTEYVPTENRADYMYFPRMMALAERLWTKNLDFDKFSKRLITHYPRLDALNIHYRLPDVEGIAGENVFTDKTTLNPKLPLEGLTIHYTTDGTLPTLASPSLTQPLEINKATKIKLAAFNKKGLGGEIYTLNYKKESYSVPVNLLVANEGSRVSYFKKFYKTSTLLDKEKADSTFTISSFNVPTSVNAPSFGLVYDGYIQIPETGIYTFYLTCDDGGILSIGGKDVIDNDGLHGPIEKTGQVALQQGFQPFKLRFIEGGGGFTLKLKYRKPNSTNIEEIPAAWLKH